METIKLVVIGGDLHYPDGSIVLICYPEGDCDTIAWPLPNPSWKVKLRRAIQDDRETGAIADGIPVETPDGAIVVW